MHFTLHQEREIRRNPNKINTNTDQKQNSPGVKLKPKSHKLHDASHVHEYTTYQEDS